MKKVLFLLTIITSTTFAQDSKNLEFIDVIPLIFEFIPSTTNEIEFTIDSNIVYKVNSILLGKSNSYPPPSFLLGLNGMCLIKRSTSYYDGSNSLDREAKLPLYLSGGTHTITLEGSSGSIGDYIKVELNCIKYIKK